jgi:GT2 family glycosyltransferase
MSPERFVVVKMIPKASVIIVTYNHKDHIVPCIESVMKQDYPVEIVVVDNGSDSTAELVERNYPSVRVMKTDKNLGYAGGNNLGIERSNGEYIIILNPDTIVEKTWLKELIKPLIGNEHIITTPKIILYDNHLINTCGNINHFTGLTFTRGYGEMPDKYDEPEYISGFSGCCFAMKKKCFLDLGSFDETFFIYNEDSELSWRAHTKGYKILYVPTSIVRHDYVLKVYPEKLYYLERNRYLILRKYYSKKDFLFLFPSFLLAEALTFGYSVKLGPRGIYYKIRAINDGLKIPVSKIKGDKLNLQRSLSSIIPVEQLSYNQMDRIIKILANKVFEFEV